ncbi:MAG: M56 family metallopeptidase [Steroidobacteraceae bacterium]
MIGALMLYCLLVATLVSGAAFLIERAFSMLGWARRIVWIAALVTAVVLPFLLIAIQDNAQTFSSMQGDAPAVLDEATATGPLTESFIAQFEKQIEPTLALAWPVLSVGFIVFIATGWWRLRRDARAWPMERVDETNVRVSEVFGPAVIGFIKPEIVVPRWVLAAPMQDRAAALAHERSHIVAGDPLLLLIALLTIALMPWNLPMWWQLSRLRFAIEVDCDRRVLRDGTSIEAYGEMLLAIGERSGIATPIGAIALIEPVSQLERRIRIMTAGNYRYVTLLVAGSLAMSTSLVAVATQLSAPSVAGIVPFASSTVEVKAMPDSAAGAIAEKVVAPDSETSLGNQAELATKPALPNIKSKLNSTIATAEASVSLSDRSAGRAEKVAPEKLYASLQPAEPVATTEAENLTLNFRDMEVRKVLQLLAETGRKNLLVSDKVGGLITIMITNAPWQQALDIVCIQAGLRQRQSGDAILIEPK